MPGKISNIVIALLLLGLTACAGGTPKEPEPVITTDDQDDAEIVDNNDLVDDTELDQDTNTDADTAANVQSTYSCGPFEAYSETDFSCMPAGELRPILDDPPKSGPSFTDVWFADMRFPLETGPAFLNSQVYGFKHPDEYNPNQPARSGQRMGDLATDPGMYYHQCHSKNYSYPWEDTFCEKRGYSTRICPGGSGHRGIDMRSAVCGADAVRLGLTHVNVVSASAGYITAIHPHYTRAISEDGSMIFYYYHMTPSSRTYQPLDLIAANNRIRVERGDVLGEVGRVGADNSLTTYHLHFEMETVIARPSDGVPSAHTHIPPYMTLIDAYKRMEVGTP